MAFFVIDFVLVLVLRFLKTLKGGPVKLADVVFAAILMNMLSSQASAGATCESLASLSLPDTTITVAQTVAAGALRLSTVLPDAGPHGGITFVAAKNLPEFCRVVGVEIGRAHV